MNHKVSLRQLITEGETLLQSVEPDTPRREAILLIAAALKKSVTEIMMMDQRTLVDPSVSRSYFTRRSHYEPFAYIVKEQGFWSLDIQVSEATLIPRPDSESLIEALLQSALPKNGVYRFLDLGTGTGCLLLAALTEYSNAYGIGVDRIPDAAVLARQNAIQCRLDHRASFMTGNWADAIYGKFDVILSNPPYIRQHELLSLMPDVRCYEPMSALDGGKDGLDAYHYICRQAANLLTDQGLFIVELGIKQEEEVTRIAATMGLSVVKRQQDLNGWTRALVFSRIKL